MDTKFYADDGTFFFNANGTALYTTINGVECALQRHPTKKWYAKYVGGTHATKYVLGYEAQFYCNGETSYFYRSKSFERNRKLLNIENNTNIINISSPVKIVNDSYIEVCEFESTKTECDFSISDAEFCCHYISAKNNYVINEKQMTNLKQQDMLTKIKSLRDIALSAFIIQTVLISFAICAFFYPRSCLDDDEKKLALYGFTAFATFINIWLLFSVIGIMDQNSLITEADNVYNHNCYTNDSVQSVQKLLTHLLELTAVLVCFEFISFCVFIGGVVKDNEMMVRFSGVVFVFDYILIISNCFAFATPAWNGYTVIYDDSNLLCYNPVIYTTTDPTYYPTIEPTFIPTDYPSVHPTKAPTQTPYKMVDGYESLLCAELSENIAFVTDVSVDECKNKCLFEYAEECVMINYINTKPSKCYLFDQQCTIYGDSANDDDVSFLVDKDYCIDRLDG